MKRAILALGASFAMIAAAQASSDSATIYALMKDIVAPQADIIWDVGSRGMNDDGEPDAAALSSQDWETLIGAAREMKAASDIMASTEGLTVAPAGTLISGEDVPGAPTARRVQQAISEDPHAFTRHAAELADISQAFILAADARDAVKLQDAVTRMGTSCEGCHKQFWYPDQ